MHDVNLILMGSGEKGIVEKYQLSTTASKVIRKSNKPVWIMKRDMTSSISRIICPIDFSDPSRRALKNAIHLARVFKAELTVLNVIEPIADKPIRLDMQLTDEQRLVAKDQTSKFEHFLKDFDFHMVKVSKEIYQGKPHQEILKRIKARKSDLLVIGTTGRTGLSRILMGSVTEKVTREVPCSFITMKDENVIRLCLEAKMNDLEACYKESNQLLEKGFAKQALNQFQLCLNIDCLYLPAWEGMAAAHDQLGHKEKAQNCRNQIKEIQERLKNQEVEFDLHRHIPFFKR
jgi:nucleotide-binding universal stress UspA family protein